MKNSRMSYNEIMKNMVTFGKGIPAKIFGWFFIIIGVLMIPAYYSNIADWNTKKDNYTKQYAYSEYGRFYYEIDNQKIYIDTIYNTDGELTTPEVPDNKTVIMYCLKTNNKECIYFNLNTDGNNNNGDSNLLQPFGIIFVILFCIALGLFLLLSVKLANKPTSTPITSIYFLSFVCGIGIFIYGIHLTSDYLRIKLQNNLVEGTIYSEIYIGDPERKTKNKQYYRPVISYYVDGKKYTYVSELSRKGNFNDNVNSKIELYYDSSEPSTAVEGNNSQNILLIFCGLLFTILGAPGLFMKKRLDQKLEKEATQSKEIEWKI